MNKFIAAIVFSFLFFSFSAALAGAGGPDGFGYEWKDSDEADGPIFDYLDISPTGTLVNGLSDDNFVGPFSIGFTFNFYGNDYTDFYLASNGVIGFGSTSGLNAFTNRVIPTNLSPNNVIAWLWDDLIPRGDTQVYYQSFSDKLVIQFVQYGSRSLANERVNAEIILYSNGKILIQYSDFTSNWPLASATVGIENGDGTDGLNVVFNASYLHNALAVQFLPGNIAPNAPILLAPSDGAVGQLATVNLAWNAVDDATSYRLQAATDALFDNLVFDDSTLTATAKQIGPLASGATYHWRVNAKNAQGTSGWSSIWSFTTQLDPQAGSAISVNTKSGFGKSNQSKVFYYDSQWWAIAFHQTDNRWYIWRYSGSSWVTTREIQAGNAYYCDAVLNTSNGKLFVFGSHKTAPYIWRFSYAVGTWNKDAGFPVMLSDFTDSSDSNPVSLVRAKNSDLWIFRINNKILEAKRSTDSGKTWSTTINVKTGLTTTTGTTDAVAFTFNNKNYVGVAYAEKDTAGSKFGFLLHRDGDPNTSWTDESASLTFFGNERASNNLCVTAAAGNVFIFTRNAGFIGQNPRNTLYKRTNTGVWKKFKVNSTFNWKTPAMAFDVANNRLYFMGVHSVSQTAAYKTCALGDEAKLDTMKTVALFTSLGASFDDLSVPALLSGMTMASGLMVCGDNLTANDIWYRHLANGDTAPLIVGAVTVAPNEVNANAAYTIPLTLSNGGALTAGAGTIHLRFPFNTLVPNPMTASEVLVNGTPATKVISNNNTKQVTITTPVNLANNQSFSVVFNSGAGLLNSTIAGNTYQLTVWTSSQPTQVSSPNYSLMPASTTVTSATVTLSDKNPGNPADYTLNFNLGANGRMLSNSSVFTVKFDEATQVTQGALSGVKVDSVSAAAVGDAELHKITITLPASISLGNNAAVKLFLPNTAVQNPNVGGAYKLIVATSVETAEVASKPYMISSLTGQAIPNTAKNFDRNNQSKMFYHGGGWWVTAQAKDDLKWYLWKLDGSVWTKIIQLNSSSKVRPDCILDGANNKAYILLPGGSTTYILRLSFASGNWTLDSGYPFAVPNFSQESDRGVCLARASNGNLWVFRINNGALEAKRSANGGQTWSANITVKSGLSSSTGLADAVAFSSGGNNYIGVGYAENTEVGAIYGFLRHRNTDADNVWTDETASIPQFSGTTSDDHISMMVHNNTVLMVVKTNGGGPATVNVGLLHRGVNGNWFQYPIILSSGWTRPALVVDAEHNELYVFGTRENSPKVVEMKHVPLGNYNDLLAAPSDTIFSHEFDDFFDISAPAHPVDGTTNLLICNGNETRNELWYNFIDLNSISKTATAAPEEKKSAAEEDFAGVKVFPNPFNPETTFRFKARESAPVKLQIFNLNGQLVRTLIDDELPAGVHQRRWNGRSNAGYRVASGVYLYRLQVGEKATNGRVQMLK